MATEGQSAKLGPELAQQQYRSIFLRTMGANLAGAVVVFTYLNFLGPPSQGGDPRFDGLVNLIVFVVYMAAAGVFAFFASRRLSRPVQAWISERRPPTPRERTVTISTPWWSATLSFALWLGAAVVFAPLNVIIGIPVGQATRVGVGIVLGGLITCTITFLAVERTRRPVLEAVLAGEAPQRSIRLGVLPRLVGSWALGSGIPLLAVALAFVGRDAGDRDAVANLAMAVCGAGLVAGSVITIAVARSLAEPIQEVRAAVERVHEGDIDVHVAVDDLSEVGMLQAGFNEMVGGLRERRRLQDLFGRHVGMEVAREALERVGLGGEQREVSVLFVDLIGSTALAQTCPVDEVVGTLNAMFGALVRVVSAEGGWVNKFEGDGAMCVFGAPSDQPDHAARALRAARALHTELAALASEHRGLDAGTGVSSGAAVAGNVGAEERYEYTVIGDPVNEAARLTEAAKERPGRVLASSAAVEVAGDEAAAWEPAGEVLLRGRSTPTSTYEPCPGAVETALHARSTPSSSTS